MNKYRITMNDKVYEMEIELVSGSAAPVQAVVPGQVAPAPTAAPVKNVVPVVSKQQSGSSGSVTSPMPGTILRICTSVGENVQAGQTVLVLEAMKMENEIAAPKAGKLIALAVNPGDTVANGEFLFEVE